MTPNPAFGVLLHWTGGLAAASFYLPYKAVKRWSWETYWLVGGFFSWIIAPAIFATLLVPETWTLITHAPSKTLFWSFFFGLTWGIGGLTFGLTVRYLGLALGYAIALGCCAAFGTLIPPLFDGTFGTILNTAGGRITLAGVFVCLLGIAVSGLAGMSKERELSDEQKRQTVREFNFSKGLIIALFCGITSAAMAFAIEAGKPLADLAQQSLLAAGRLDIWQGLPVLVVVLWGGFLTNCVWCIGLNIKNRTARQYIAPATNDPAPLPVPLAANYALSAAAGLIWYLQFFFYTMGTTQMGAYGFSSWTLHMASIIIFSTLWGIGLKEWRGSSHRTLALLTCGLALLIGSTVIVGYGNYKNAQDASPPRDATSALAAPHPPILASYLHARSGLHFRGVPNLLRCAS
jgi:L-rhamnose-H+ transport protein